MNEDSIFLEALEKGSAEARAAFLDQACAGNAELRDSVERLLRAHERADEVLSDHAPGLPVTRARAASEWIGTHIGPYKLLEQIGEGGFGVVLKARDEKLERVVAIKVLAPELASNPTARKRFLREARAAASVVHQHVVTIHAVDENPFPYLVMEYIDGQSPQDKLDRQGHLELKEILRIGQQVAAGLAAAHAHGLIHRDVKPANIMLENSVERVRISDFGLARAVDDVGVTRTGEVAGTPQYMSPEQAQGLALDARSDLFSFGSVLYAMCTGRAPFRAETTIDAIRRVCDDTPRPIQEINPEIPPWLIDIINRLLAKQPSERFQTAQEVADLLARHLAEVQHPFFVRHSSGLPSDSGAGWKSAPLTIAAVLLCLLVALGLSEATSTTHLTAAVIGLFARKATPIADTNTPPATVPPAAPLAPVPESQAFVLLGKSGAAVGKFDTLAEAVLGAASGDTIEIRGNGPFLSKEIVIGTPLTIRAGEGFCPVIKADSELQGSRKNLITTSDALVLEGLEMQWINGHVEPPNVPKLMFGSGPKSRLHVANCRFLMNRSPYPGQTVTCVQCPSTAHVRVQNCLFLTGGPGFAIMFYGNPHSEMIIDNCLMIGQLTLNLESTGPVTALIRRNTILGKNPNSPSYRSFMFALGKRIEPPVGEQSARPYSVESLANIFETPTLFRQLTRFLESEKALTASEAEQFLPRLVAWREREDLYAFDSGDLIEMSTMQASPDRLLSPTLPLGTQADLQRFWGTEDIDFQRGTVRFHGEGRIGASRDTNPEQITPDDFRLRPDSAGYRAGPDGKDLGADVDLVSPGPAYERWKKMPEYQEWLKDSGQVK